MLLLSPGDRHNHPEDHDTKMGQPRNENSGWSREESVGKTESREKNLQSSGWLLKRDFREQHSSTRALMCDERARHTESQQRARTQGESSGHGTAPPRRQVGEGEGWISEPCSLGVSHLLLLEPAELFLRVTERRVSS